MTAPVLHVESIAWSVRGRPVLSDASLVADAGRVVFLAGRNGAGKSTLLKVAAGLLPPAEGVVRWCGSEIPRGRLHAMARLGLFYLPDASLFSPSLSVRTQLRMAARRWRTTDDNAIEAAAERLGIAGVLDRRPRSLSGGERRKANVALALVRRPRCLLADEPLRGVSPIDAEAILAAFRTMAGEGTAVVVTGHDVPLLLPAVDAIVWVMAGRTYAYPSASAAERDPRFREEFLGLANANPPMAETERDASARSSKPAPKGESRIAPRGSAPVAAEEKVDPPAASPTPSGHLRVDAQTLKDLEVFERPGGGSGLFDELCHTRTAGGRIWLQRHFRAPPCELERIREMQDAVRFAADHPQPFVALPVEDVIQAMQRYRASSYVTSERTSGLGLAAEGLWLRLRSTDDFDELARGVAATAAFVRAAWTAAAALQRLSPPRHAARLADGVVQALSVDAMRELRDGDASASPVGLLRCDQEVRERLRGVLDRVLAAVHELDGIQSMGRATRERGFAFPTFHAGDEPPVRIGGAVHPFVRNAVGNDLALAPGKRMAFVTGPNMAGKTTYMRACALCVLLAHVGMGVPAQAMSLAPHRALFTAVSVSDDSRRGVSYFMAEVRRVREAARLVAEGGRVFLLFDEPFKGTNVHDATDATAAVVTRLARVERCTVLVSSHLAELAAELAADPSIECQCFDAVLREGTLTFDYRLKPGISAQRLGMVLLERAGVFSLLDTAAGPAPSRFAPDESRSV